MSTVTKYTPGTFCWIDLATSDAAGAEKFYTSLFGWTTEAIPLEAGMAYVKCKLNGQDAAAFYQPTAEHSGGLPPHWKSYVAVSDADAAARRAVELGGQLVFGPMDVFTAGRMAIVIDPSGAMVALWQPRDHAGAGIVNEPGALIWNELMTHDTKIAGEFYAGLFDWKIETVDMGTMVYTMFSNCDRPNGGMFQITPEMGPVPPNWFVYFAVEDTDASAALAAKLGGQVMKPPADIPGVGRFAVILDPQGAAFGIIKMLREPTPYEG